MTAPRCCTCHRRLADLRDDATNKPMCAKCWLKKYDDEGKK